MDCWKSISWLAVDDTYSNCMKKKYPITICVVECENKKLKRARFAEGNHCPAKFFFFSFLLTKQETGCFRCCCFSVFFVPILMMPFFVFSLFRKNWIWLHPTGRQCWLYRRKRNGKFTATGKRWDPERTLGKRRGGGRRRKTTMTPSSCYERRLSGVIVVVLPVYFLFEPYFFTPWPSPENSTQFCLAAFDVPVASPPPHFTIYFYPVKSEQKRKKRERE